MSSEEDDGNSTILPTCVLCVGSTGSGKSATIAKYTSLPIQSNAGAKRVTEKCSIYRRPGEKLAWIDTVGWDDIHFEDDETFKIILKFIDDNFLTQIKAVIWNVHPNVRHDALLASQAKLIDKFAPTEIWNNVIILVKQSLNPEEDGRGALSAALDFNAKARTQLLGFRFLTDETMNVEQRQQMQGNKSIKEAFNIWTDDEVRKGLSDALEEISEPIQVVFRSKRCLDCNQRGDERLFGKYCHMQPHYVHTGISELCHPGFTEPYHKNFQIEWKHPGRLLRLPSALGGSRYSCCYKKANQKGCRGRWECCGIGPGGGIGCRTRYNCCLKDISSLLPDAGQGCQQRYACCRGRPADPGCTKCCKKCDQLFGTPTDSCYAKEHNVVDSSSDTCEEEELLETDFNNEGNVDNAVLQRDNSLPPVILIHVF